MSGRFAMADWQSRFDRCLKIWRWLPPICLVAFLLIGWWRSAIRQRDLPSPHFSAARPAVSPDRCMACHVNEVLSAQQAPHSKTLQPATTEELLNQFHGLVYKAPETSEIDRFEAKDRSLWLHHESLAEAVPVHWIFGSGRHARTPVTVLNTNEGAVEIIEHRLSWYPDSGIDLTLGLGNLSGKPGYHGIGKRLNIDDAADCFGCHSSWLPTSQGKLDLVRMQAGIECSRCHQEGEDHIQSATAGRPDLNPYRWSELSPIESIRRCGECHRRDDQMTHFEVRPTNPVLIRFAPVGISQSRCFTEQDRIGLDDAGEKLRFDCMTCHDPHRPAETRPQFYIDRCVGCHSGQSGRASVCSGTPTSTQCLDCHMPKVDVHPHLRFTDHWIRKRPVNHAAASDK